MKDILKDLQTQLDVDVSTARRSVMVPLLTAVQGFVGAYMTERKAGGVAEFHDLLVWARDLLRDNVEVRDHFRSKFSHIFLDEFQDTDPIQAEIAMFLAEDVPAGTPIERRPRQWTDVRAEPGKLFVVGDPKQSIYRFRRADVAVSKQMREAMGVEPLQLSQSFRSQEPIISWVNHVFSQWLDGLNGQVDYGPLVHRWRPGQEHPVAPGVHRLGEALDHKHVGPVRREEAIQIAQLLRQVARGDWPVLDRRASGKGDVPTFRPGTLSDVCVLMPQRTSLRGLEWALEDAGIAYRIEGASLIFGTQEVRDLVNCLRAVDDPGDPIAVVAALRSPAFACSDVDLALFVEHGGGFDYLSPTNTDSGPVADGMKELEQFHHQRLWASPTALIETFIRSRRLREIALGGRRPEERWRRYDFVVEQARQFHQAGGDSLRGFLQWLEGQMEQGVPTVDSPVIGDDEDAVRVMTVHGAKGLEFPIVILTGLNSNPRAPADSVLFHRNGGGAEVRLGPSRTPFETMSYQATSEREKDAQEQERVRLLYVACTRARDHLVLSLYRTAKDNASPAARLEAALDGNDDLWSKAPTSGASLPTPTIGDTEPGGDDDTPERRQRWMEGRDRVLTRMSRPPSVAATTLAEEAKEEQAEPEQPWRRGRAGTHLGRAVHAVLQSIDLGTGEGLDATASAQATAEGIPDQAGEVVRLARTALDSSVVKRAVSATRHWREMPVSAPMEEGLLEGFLDLVFEEDDGLVIVDYKTDSLESQSEIEQAMHRYRLQAGSYALALERSTDLTVKEVVFLFLQPKEEVTLREIDELKAEAWAAVRRHYAQWR